MQDRLAGAKDIDPAKEKDKQQQAILSMSVCDPACGSGDFLLAAALPPTPRRTSSTTSLTSAKPFPSGVCAFLLSLRWPSPSADAIIMSRTVEEVSGLARAKVTRHKFKDPKGLFQRGSACGPVIVPVFKTGGRQGSCRRCVRLTLASAKTKDLTCLALCLRSVECEANYFRGRFLHLIRHHGAVNVHCGSDVRVTHELLLYCNRCPYCVKPTPISVSHCVHAHLANAGVLRRFQIRIAHGFH